MATALDQVIALLRLLLTEIAGLHRSAVVIDAMNTRMTGLPDPDSKQDSDNQT